MYKSSGERIIGLYQYNILKLAYAKVNESYDVFEVLGIGDADIVV